MCKIATDADNMSFFRSYVLWKRYAFRTEEYPLDESCKAGRREGVFADGSPGGREGGREGVRKVEGCLR